MQQAGYFARLERALSASRLAPYRPVGGTERQLLAHYLWNIALSEALYPSLQSLEVALRNAIHNAATRRFGTPYWFDPQTPLILEGRERDAVYQARQELLTHQRRRHGTAAPAPLRDGQIVAQLMFGFWTGLFNAPYEQRLWAPPAPGGGILGAVFPHAPRRWRSRRRLLQRLQPIRLLRNRVSHYEHLWDWAQSGVADLGEQHRQLVELIDWIDPAVGAFVRPLDRFPGVYTGGAVAYEALLPI